MLIELTHKQLNGLQSPTNKKRHKCFANFRKDLVFSIEIEYLIGAPLGLLL